jgi:hypothetical protein
MVNIKLLKIATPEKLQQMGFIMEDDGTNDPRGVDWNIRNDKFHLLIDPWMEVKLARRNPDTDFITIAVDDLSELQSVIDWIADE